MKEIKNCPGYFVDMEGNVYSNRQSKGKEIRKMSPYRGSYNGRSKEGYYSIDFLVNGNKVKKIVHRLVAEAFVDNPCNLPQVDHIDKNILNNNADNLRWVSAYDNLIQSYDTMGPVRNFKKCTLLKDGEVVKEFDSILEAAKYAEKFFGMSKASMAKYRKVKNMEIISKV